MRLYWARCGYRNGNAGDEFNVALLEALGVSVTWAPPEEADVVLGGSVLHHLPSAFAGTIVGAGCMFEHERPRLERARFSLLRGPLTVARCATAPADTPVGDVGLLADTVYADRGGRRYRVGVVPHYVDAQDERITAWARAWQGVVTVIDICAPVRDVLRAITECELVLSSSLHGLVFADAYGIPNHWIALSDKLAGGVFKFRDYYAAHGLEALAVLTPDAAGFEPPDHYRTLRYTRQRRAALREAVAAQLERLRLP